MTTKTGYMFYDAFPLERRLNTSLDEATFRFLVLSPLNCSTSSRVQAVLQHLTSVLQYSTDSH